MSGQHETPGMPGDGAADRLIAAYLDGTLDDARFDELAAMLHERPELLARLAELSQLDRMIADELSHEDRVDLVMVEPGDGLPDTLPGDDSGAVLAQLAALESQAGEVELVDFTEEYARRVDQAKVRKLKRLRAGQRLAPNGQDSTKQPLVLPKAFVWLGLAATIGLMVWVGWPKGQSEPTASPAPLAEDPADPAATDTVAVINSSIGAQWVGSRPDRRSRLHAGQSLVLAEGYAEVLFEDGAFVIVQGPASFEPTGPNGMRLVSGSVTARVPESAHGFTVATTGGLVVDHGTEFGVRVDADGRTLTQTFSGLVSVAPPDGTGGWDREAELSLRAGDALVSDAQSGLRWVETDEAQFVRGDEYAARLASEDSDYHRWLAYSYELRRDPALLAYYLFDRHDAANGALRNHAPRTGHLMDGELGHNGDSATAPRWVDGRFAEKRGLRFGIIDQARARAVHIRGFGGYDVGQALTLAVWVRIPEGAGGAAGGTLLSLRDATVEHLSFQFSLFLQGDIYANRLQFGTGNELRVEDPNESFRYSDRRTVDPGGWHLVTVVYDGETAAFYLDGVFISRSEPVGPITVTRPDTPLLIGTDPFMPAFNRNTRVEAFEGDMDEVVILGREMSPDEIKQMYQAGQPAI